MPIPKVMNIAQEEEKEEYESVAFSQCLSGEFSKDDPSSSMKTGDPDAETIARQMGKASLSSNDFKEMERLIRPMTEIYEEASTLDKKLEVLFAILPLAKAKKGPVTNALLQFLITSFAKINPPELDQKLFFGIYQVLYFSDQVNLQHDDLKSLLEVLNEKGRLFSSDQKSSELYPRIQVMALILEIINKHKKEVVKLSKDNLESLLIQLMEHSDWKIAAKAAQAKERLEHILGKKSEEGGWYDAFYFVTGFIRRNQFNTIESCLSTKREELGDNYFYFFRCILLVIIEKIFSSEEVITDKVKAIDILVRIYLNADHWKSSKSLSTLRIPLLRLLKEAACSQQDDIRDAARRAVTSIDVELSSLSEEERTWFKKHIPKQIETLPIIPEARSSQTLSPKASSSLVVKAAKQKIKTPEELITGMKERYVNGIARQQSHIADYTPPFCSSGNPFAENQSLDGEIHKFLQGLQLLYLIKGDPKSGKTTCCKNLRFKLWEEFQKGGPIPLLLELTSRTDPAKIIDEALKNEEFLDAQIAYFKQNFSFILILDDFHKIKKINLLRDAFTGIKVDKVIVTSDSCHLMEEDLVSLFAPYRKDQPDETLFSWTSLIPYANYGQPLHLSHPFPILNFALSSDMRWLVSVSGPSAYIWDLQKGSMVKKVNVKNSEGIDSKIHTAQFSLDNSSLAIAGDDRFVRIYNLKALQDEPKTTKVGHKKAIQTSLFLPNYQLATASSDFFVITNIGNKEISGTMRGIDSDAQQIAIAPKGKYFALVDSDNQICINGKQKLPKENKGEITSCAFSPNGEWFVSTSKDELVVIWKLEKAEYKLHKKLTTHPGAVTASCFSPDGKLMATAGLSAINEEKKEEEAEKKLFSSVVYLWSTESFSMVQKIEEVRGSISSCCFTSDGKFLLTGSDDKAVRFWQIKNSEGRSSLK